MNRIIALAVALTALSSVAAVAAAQPTAGIYHALNYALSVKGSDCNVTVGQFHDSTWFWPGAAKTGATERDQDVTSSGGPELHIHTYPETPAAGVTKWSGTEKSTFVPPSTKGSAKFSATLTYADASSFLMKVTFSFGNCTETFSDSLVLQGIR